jgi:hypothetical protein
VINANTLLTMSVLRSYLLGLIVAHVAWLFFFTTGQLLWKRHSDNSKPFGLDTLVITSVAGMALSGFGLLLLGFTHLLNRFGLASLLVLDGAFFWLLKRDNWLSFIFWRRMVQDFIKGWTFPAVCIYVLFMALGIPAIQPPIRGEPLSYHLAYAADWANAGRIYVDSFLRFPYYANNFLLFDSAFFILKLDDYCHFLTWLCGLLTCLGVLAFFAPAEWHSNNDQQHQRRLFPFLPQFLIPLSLAVSPVFLQYLNTGYLDVPIGLFILVSVLCVYKTLSHRLFARELVVIAAFCVGMKLTLIGHLPFFVISLLLVSARRLPRREMALLVVALVGLSSPWYIRNLLEAHDPTPPIFNMLFDHPDPVFSQGDAAWIYLTGKESDLRNPVRLLSFPFQYFIGAGQTLFGRDGVSAAFLLLYAPAVFLLVMLFCRKARSVPAGFVYLSVSVTYLAIPWLYNPDGRHALHWFPVLIAWIGVVISLIYLRANSHCDTRIAAWVRIAIGVFCFALIVPSPTHASVGFYRKYYLETSEFVRMGGDRKRYLENKARGYQAVEAVIKTLVSEHKQQTHVLVMEGITAPHFQFRKNANIISVGDWFGPARYWDLYSEVTQGGDCLSYLTRLNISAVISKTRPGRAPWWDNFYAKFRRCLRNNNYIEYRCGDQSVAIFLKSDIKPHASLQAVP